MTQPALLESLERRKDTEPVNVFISYARAHASQLLRYVLVGSGLAAANLAFLYGVRTWLHLSDATAVTAMYIFGVLIHFPSHRWITYSAQDRPVRPQLLRYVVMLVWNFAVMQTVVALAARASISPYIAVMAATGLTMVSNFLAMAHIVFARRRAESQQQLLEVLRQRGVTSGEVGTVGTLLDHVKYEAVVLDIGSPPPPAGLAPFLADAAAHLEPGALLVMRLRSGVSRNLIDPGHGDIREAAHLLLLRSGYEQVWAHQHGETLCVSARRAPTGNPRRTCSIIVPVFNEQGTFPELMRRVLDKRLDHLGLEREIIIVESNSTDGTREEVAAFAATPGVRILWQDRPRGKGHAVRQGFAAATGDIILIQDADLEYDVNDYDALLEPLLRGSAAFVLGSRHSGGPGMRRFTEQRLLGEVFNFGHHCFTLLINVLYGQRMRDPFTMYKVFRRDCLYGLEFECNRFDFDHELLIKLLLKGYRPLEIPVRYRSRSFKEGKKIRPLRDALTWLVADFKYRLKPLRPRLD